MSDATPGPRRGPGEGRAPRIAPGGSPTRTGWSRLGGRRRVLRRVLFSVAPDVLGLLVAQGEVSVVAMDAFERWSQGGSVDAAAEVHRLEHDADDARRALLAALRSALVTPIDQEDLYVLSERCDRVVNQAKSITNTAAALSWTPDHHGLEMAAHLHTAMARTVEGFGALLSAPDSAGAAADAVVGEARAVEHGYRVALAELLREDDPVEALRARELYGAYARGAELAVAVADRLWYAVLAER